LAYLKGNGHQALVVAAGPGPDEALGFRVARVAGVRFPLYPELTLSPLAPGLADELRAFRPDVVHLAGPCVLGAAALHAARKLRLPTAAHFQTDIAGYARFFGFPWLAPVLWGYLIAVHNRCLANYAPTETLAGELRQRGMRSVRVSGRGVDTQLFTPSRVVSCRHDMLYVGRVSPEKNIDWLIDLVDALPERRLRIVGDGPGRAALERRLEGRNVSFSGFLYGTDLAEAFASAKLFVFPSHTETFGQVVQEAMASGLPVVGVRSGGVADLVQPGETGLLSAPGDRRGFVEAARTLLSDTDSRQRMASNARAFALQRLESRVRPAPAG